MGVETNSNYRVAATVFADIVDSTAMGVELSVRDYAEVVDELKEVAHGVHGFLRKCIVDSVLAVPNSRGSHDVEFSVRGDEVCFILTADPDDHGTQAVLAMEALRSAVVVKYAWLVVDHNKRRVTQNGQLPHDLAIGIHVGPVDHRVRHPRTNESVTADEAKPTSEGFAISVAKRVESEARNGTFSRIFLSDSAKHWVEDFAKSDWWGVPAMEHRGPLTDAKGLPAGRFHAHELIGINDTGVSWNAPIPMDSETLRQYESMARQYSHEAWLRGLVGWKYRVEGNKCVKAGRHGEADEHYQKASEVSGTWWRLWHDWGQLSLRRGDHWNPALAADRFRRAWDLQSDAICPARAYIHALLWTGDRGAAVDAARRALALLQCTAEDLDSELGERLGEIPWYQRHRDYWAVLEEAQAAGACLQPALPQPRTPK